MGFSVGSFWWPEDGVIEHVTGRGPVHLVDRYIPAAVDLASHELHWKRNKSVGREELVWTMGV